MSERSARIAVAIGGALALCLAASAQAQGSGPQWSGYYKNLLLQSDTWSGEPFTLDLNRLRIELKGELSSALRFDLQYDNELLLGNYLRTAQFLQHKDIPPPQYWRADANYVDTPRLFGTHRLHRATLNVSAGDTDLRIGRQRIAWGTGRFWSPLDVLNPVSPIALEREERIGVDAVLAEHRFGPLSRLAAVAAPSRSSGRSTVAVQWHANAGGLDYSLIGGRMLGRRIWGFDLAGQIGQSGIRSEVTHERPRGGAAYSRVLIGLDHAFANTLAITAELFFNGSGAPDPAGYDFDALMSGAVPALGRRYAGVHASYELTPLLKWDGDVVINLADRSRYLALGLTYSLRTNLDLRLGMQRFSGAVGTEYSRPPDAVHAQVQQFF
ncbi:hypothetical protein [Piscinibacter sp.]|uniref:hypothetical protein n=1 Tax=Piscinibacter sp. TaxID=1903157 RepID=UPI002C7C648A|nr:hypothetical protein [Albitalea sp.]HUG24487.1 hypothetical protein [Albitalea sp.]